MISTIIAASLAANPARAVPAANTNGIFDGNLPDAQTVTSPGAYTNNPSNEQESLNYTLQPLPQLSAETKNSGSAVATTNWGNPGEFGREDGVNAYYFTVVGPAGAVNVQVHASGSISAHGGSTTNTYNGFFSYTAESQFGVYPTPGNQSALTYASAGVSGFWVGQGNIGQPPSSNFVTTSNVTGDATNGFDGSWVDNDVITLTIGDPYMVSLDAFTGGNQQGGSGIPDTFASVDPWFSIASSVTDPQDYSFVFSDGVGNTPANAVPEPGTLVLLGTGLIGMSAIRRRRRSRA